MPLNTPFAEKKTRRLYNIIYIYSFSRPFEVLQADIAYITFLARLAVDRKFCLFFVDSFTSKIYTYPMKKMNRLAKKMELFYKDIEKMVVQNEVTNRSRT